MAKSTTARAVHMPLQMDEELAQLLESKLVPEISSVNKLMVFLIQEGLNRYRNPEPALPNPGWDEVEALLQRAEESERLLGEVRRARELLVKENDRLRPRSGVTTMVLPPDYVAAVRSLPETGAGEGGAFERTILDLLKESLAKRGRIPDSEMPDWAKTTKPA